MSGMSAVLVCLLWLVCIASGDSDLAATDIAAAATNYAAAATAAAAAAATAATAAGPSDPSSPEPAGDLLLLSLQWPPSRLGSSRRLTAEYGAAVASGLVSDGFTLHGLWQADPCPGPGAAAALVLPHAHLPLLSFHWPDVTPGRPVIVDNSAHQQLWMHEWAQHGSCYRRCAVLGHRCGAAYFLDAVRAAAGAPDLKAVLAGAGIAPSATETYRGEGRRQGKAAAAAAAAAARTDVEPGGGAAGCHTGSSFLRTGQAPCNPALTLRQMHVAQSAT